MKTTTATIITGKEELINDTMNVRYKVELHRENNEAKLQLRFFLDNYWNLVDTIYGSHSTDGSFNDSLLNALEKAKTRWNIEVQLKKVA